MKKLTLSLLSVFFPALVQAAGGALSFAPPTSDVSVVFLSNIFGVVDGVLSGTGSQILGTIFGVFNAAVLALGGIVIMYTLMVSTVNTAHEGQMLGKKWSSMWVPVRSTLGLSLLIPKASGYCLMQTFFMWVVLQGVGAADKVWEAALGYLNRGGVIVQQQINPITSLMGGGWSIANGAAKILYGQTCMAGLQSVLTSQRAGYLQQKSKSAGPCSTASPDSAMGKFCSTVVPDFIGTVNAVSFQTDNPQSSGSYELPMPYFTDKSSPYFFLNGICGTINWNVFDTSSLSSISGLGTSGLDTTKLARATAIQQMYINLSMTANIMVRNNPALNPSTNPSNGAPFAPFASNQFGIPISTNGTACPPATLGASGSNCVGWGTSGAGAALFNGTQFQGAIAAYNAIMLPPLNLISQAKNSTNANGQRAFIQKAISDGWMLAGSYFFNLASINSANTTTSTGSATPIDSSSGLEKSTFTITTLSDAFNTDTCQGTRWKLCEWFRESPNGKPDATKIALVQGMIDGSPDYSTKMPTIPSTTINAPVTFTAQTGPQSSNAYGFVNNSLMISLPGQAGMAPPNFVMNLIPSFGTSGYSLPEMSYGCGEVQTYMFGFCFMKMLGAVIYNVLVVNLFQFFLSLVTGIINTVVMAFLALPLTGMAQIFQNGVAFIKQPDVNPIIALANMGTNYINFSADLWMYLLMLEVTTSLLGPFGIFIYALVMMAMPLLMAWLSTMLAIGFLTAYYIPFLPYTIFTFGSIAWLMAVVEAMVAAPIVALGVTHPEGEGPFGKAEQAIMILMNVFLRPSLMIIGYIAGIILSYVCVWVINAGFSNVLPFIQGPAKCATSTSAQGWVGSGAAADKGFTQGVENALNKQSMSNYVDCGMSVFDGVNFKMSGGESMGTGVARSNAFDTQGVATGYVGWAGIYGFFFSILIYTSLYITVVQKSFTLISTLPDKVLRWIGGQPESAGGESAGWAEDTKKQVMDAGTGEKGIEKAQGQMGKEMGGKAMQGFQKLTGKGTKVSSSGKPPESTKSAPDGDGGGKKPGLGDVAESLPIE